MDEFQSKAFEIDGEIEPDDNEPLTGEEYLKRVRWHSNRCPSVAIATNIDYNKLKIKSPSKNYFTLPPSITRCRKELLPTEKWEKEFINNFSEFRQRLKYIKENCNSNSLNIQLPHINDKRYWYLFCFGNDTQFNINSNNQDEDDEEEEEEGDNKDDDEELEDQEEEEEIEDNNDKVEEQEMDYENKKQVQNSTKSTTITNNSNKIKGNKPTVEILCKLDHVLTVKLVNYHIEWLEKREFNQERSYWLYMLLSKLDKPIDPDTSSNLRSCLRRLSLFRSKITDLNDSNLPSINILFTIISKYFEQLEPNEVLSL